MTVLVRSERPEDEEAIDAVIAAAFAGHPHSDGSEPRIVRGLRSAGALTVALVAEIDGAVVGHLAISPIGISDGTEGWHGLGPIAVSPEHQGEGIGTALMETGLSALQANSAKGCVVLGEPDYYGRFGFVHDPALTFPGPPAEYFQAIAFDGPVPKGTVAYHAAFGG